MGYSFLIGIISISVAHGDIDALPTSMGQSISGGYVVVGFSVKGFLSEISDIDLSVHLLMCRHASKAYMNKELHEDETLHLLLCD